MKKLDRKVTLLCPLCGNDQFASLDEEFEDLLHASDDVRMRCSDCGSEYTKRELIDNNAAIIDNAVDELAQDAIKELEKELKKAMKNGSFDWHIEGSGALHKRLGCANHRRYISVSCHHFAV